MIALACVTWPARALAAFDLVVLVFPVQIFVVLSQLDVSALWYLIAMITAGALR